MAAIKPRNYGTQALSGQSVAAIGVVAGRGSWIRRRPQDVVEGGGEINLTEMSDAALMDLVKLDINAAGV